MDGPYQPGGPARPALRASDADRERVVTLLRDNYSDGRLTLEEFQERLQQAYASKTLAELDTLTADLPIPTKPAPQPVVPEPPAVTPLQHRVRDRMLTYLVLMLFLIGIWAASGRNGSFWPIWPMLVGAMILAFSMVGLERPGSYRHQRRMERRRHRLDRHDR